MAQKPPDLTVDLKPVDLDDNLNPIDESRPPDIPAKKSSILPEWMLSNLSGGMFGRAARSVSDVISQPTLPRLDPNSMLGKVESFGHKISAMQRGLAGGAIEGAGDLADEFSKPVDLIPMALSGFSGIGAKVGMKGLSKAMSIGSRVMSAPTAIHGSERLIDPNSTLSERIMGGVEIAGGLAGMKYSGSKTSDDTAKAIADEIAVLEKPEVPSVIRKLYDAMDESRALNPEQAAILTAERAEKFGDARNVLESNLTGETLTKAMMARLAGQHTKVTRSPLVLDQVDTDDLHNMIADALRENVIGQDEGAGVITGLNKLMQGGVPVPSEIARMEKVFGSGFAERIQGTNPMNTRNLFLKTANSFKSIKSSFDIGIFFRQGINHVGSKEWRGMILPTIKSYGSKAAFTKVQEAIHAEPLYDNMMRGGLALTDLNVRTNRQELALNTWTQNLAPVRMSNQAYVGGLGVLRSGLYKTKHYNYQKLYESAKDAASFDINPISQKAALEAAEKFNPNSLYRMRLMSDEINVSTGRGSLGSLENMAEELNATLFAPRLISARVRSLNRVFNPLSYIKYDSIQRKSALKQLTSIVGTALTTAASINAAGGKVEVDPRSSDFLKGQIGKVRIDMMGGYQQYMVPMTKILTNSAVSVFGDKPYSLGIGGTARKFGMQTGKDVFYAALENKESPLMSLSTAFFEGAHPGGKPFNTTSLNPMENSITKSTIMPMLTETLYELYQEDPNLIPWLLPVAAVGGGVGVYNEKKKKGKF